MKYLLFILLSLMLMSYNSSAHNNVWAFPDSGMIWCQHEGGGDGFSMGYTIDYEIISTGKDTLVDGKKYIIMLSTGTRISGPFGMQEKNTFKDEFFGMFWNDTLNKRVDCYTPTGRFMYDFDMEVGDTVKWIGDDYLSSGMKPFIVDSIDTVI